MLDKLTFHTFDSVNSTQLIAKKLIDEQKITHAHVIMAKTQTNGRGRYERSWISPNGGLYMTIVLVPQDDRLWSQLSYVAGISLCEAIIKLDYKCMPTLKWINDVLINSKKIAGILLEVYNQRYILMGIGVNISKNEEIISLGYEVLNNWSDKFTIDNIVQEFFKLFTYNYNLWLIKGFDPIVTLWLRYAHGIGKNIKVKFRTDTQEGIFIGIDESGKLQLLKDGKIINICAGEVYLD